MADLSKNGKKVSRTFVLRLVWSCFKWDIMLCLVLALVLKLLEYSTSFFIYRILQIKVHYQPEEYQIAFILLAGAMLFFKLITSITSENVVYFFVN
jgi:hypothetical protein